jgi:hypothetical protein
MGPSSLLSATYNKQGQGIFAGDRFIPCRPEETYLDGAEQYRHEENLLLTAHLQLPSRRRNSNVSNEDNHSSHSSDNHSDNSQRSSDDNSQGSIRAIHQRQEQYNNLLTQQVFGSHPFHNYQNLTDVTPSSFEANSIQTLKKIAQVAGQKPI